MGSGSVPECPRDSAAALFPRSGSRAAAILHKSQIFLRASPGYRVADHVCGLLFSFAPALSKPGPARAGGGPVSAGSSAEFPMIPARVPERFRQAVHH
ncbi:MAG: hypothetical protein DRH37_08465 [Deltaproteobacteria bacterium]|nr:MAG: hypothetical protein DRH37_08465 [Deltaproteobacteria bacterium]